MSMNPIEEPSSSMELPPEHPSGSRNPFLTENLNNFFGAIHSLDPLPKSNICDGDLLSFPDPDHHADHHPLDQRIDQENSLHNAKDSVLESCDGQASVDSNDLINLVDEPPVYLPCGVCHKAVNTARASPASGQRLDFGIVLACESEHVFCQSCLADHLRAKLSEGENGGDVFPIRCPSCPEELEWEIGTDKAGQVLSEEDMMRWWELKMAHQCKFCSAPFRRTFQPSQLPFLATLSYATRLPAGVLLDCPRNHGYCNPCMNDYLRTKLKEAEEGGDVFLIAVRCPDCKFGSYQIPDAEAEKILSKDDMIRWWDLKSSYTCGICMEPFRRQTSHQTPPSSQTSRLSLGIVIPCARRHTYCTTCMTGYLRSKLEEGTKGVDIFPVKCPECKAGEWQMGDKEVEVVLTGNDLALWNYQKHLHVTPKYYCPNPACSTLILVEDNPKIPRVECPGCSKPICVSCGTIWHPKMTCEQYQAIPEDERTPEDRLLLKLAKSQKWSRCRKCSTVVERVSGCVHMTCRCGSQFCYSCGSDWVGHCTRIPACSTLNEKQLQEERTRGRQIGSQAGGSRRSGVGLKSGPGKDNRRMASGSGSQGGRGPVRANVQPGRRADGSLAYIVPPLPEPTAGSMESGGRPSRGRNHYVGYPAQTTFDHSDRMDWEPTGRPTTFDGDRSDGLGTQNLATNPRLRSSMFGGLRNLFSRNNSS